MGSNKWPTLLHFQVTWTVHFVPCRQTQPKIYMALHMLELNYSSLFPSEWAGQPGRWHTESLWELHSSPTPGFQLAFPQLLQGGCHSFKLSIHPQWSHTEMVTKPGDTQTVATQCCHCCSAACHHICIRVWDLPGPEAKLKHKQASADVQTCTEDVCSWFGETPKIILMMPISIT